MRIPPTTYSLCSLRWGAPAQFDEVYLDKICDAWAVYDEQEIRDVFMFIDNEPLEDMIGTIGSYEYEIIPLDDDRFVIGDPALIKESISC